MSREVRMVPPNWQHPSDGMYPDGSVRYIPMFEFSYAEIVREWEESTLPDWLEGERLWRDEGKVETYSGIKTISEVVADAAARGRAPQVATYDWWAGERPQKPEPGHYMPEWPESERTHYMMYESVSEGTPISPAFATAEELARWLADTNASAFADQGASYEDWLKTIYRGGSLASAVLVDGELKSGVSA